MPAVPRLGRMGPRSGQLVADGTRSDDELLENRQAHPLYVASSGVPM